MSQEMSIIHKKQIKAAITYTFVFFGVIFLGYLYLVDGYMNLFSQGEEAQKIHDQLIDTQKNGVDVERLSKILDRTMKDKRQIAPLLADKDKAAEAIKKPATVTARYDEWLFAEAGKESQLDAEVKRNSDIIGNIIPMFAQQNIVNANLKEVDNVLDYKTFIEYIELNLLKRFQLESYSSISL